MEETKRRFPSLPPNYVSLQQLQEQRLRKQQQKKEEEEEEEEEEEQRLKEEKQQQQQKEAVSLPPNYVSLQQLQQQRLGKQQQKKEEEQRLKEEKEKQQKEAEGEEDKKKTLPRIKSYDQTSFSNRNRNGRNFSQKSSWLIKEKNEEVEPESNNEAATSQKKKRNKYKRNGTSEIQKVDAEIINVVVVEAEELPDHQNLKEIETKKKKKKKNKGKKPMFVEEEEEEEETLIKESLPPPNENDATDVKKKKNTRTRFRRRRDQKPPPPESVNQTMEVIEQKIGDLKICDDDDDDEKKSTVEKKNKNDYYYNSREMRYRRKPMDGNLMWIRKDEKTDGFSVCATGKFENRF